MGEWWTSKTLWQRVCFFAGLLLFVWAYYVLLIEVTK